MLIIKQWPFYTLTIINMWADTIYMCKSYNRLCGREEKEVTFRLQKAWGRKFVPFQGYLESVHRGARYWTRMQVGTSWCRRAARIIRYFPRTFTCHHCLGGGCCTEPCCKCYTSTPHSKMECFTCSKCAPLAHCTSLEFLLGQWKDFNVKHQTFNDWELNTKREKKKQLWDQQISTIIFAIDSKMSILTSAPTIHESVIGGSYPCKPWGLINPRERGDAGLHEQTGSGLWSVIVFVCSAPQSSFRETSDLCRAQQQMRNTDRRKPRPNSVTDTLDTTTHALHCCDRQHKHDSSFFRCKWTLDIMWTWKKRKKNAHNMM